MAARNKSDRKYFDGRVGALTNERSSFIPHYKDLSRYTQPRRGRFFTSDRNKGTLRHQSIINSQATQALRTARTGLFSGVMNPARPWFRYATDDPDLMEFGPVKVWLGQLEELTRNIFDAGNLYNQAPVLFGELMLFATGCMLHVDDFEDVARFYTQTAGSYLIAQNQRQQVTTLVRQFEMTVEQLVGEFGTNNVSQMVRDRWDRGNYESWVPVIHFIDPNPDFDPRRVESRFKAWRSTKYELGNTDREKFLSRKGFDRFPAYCPRWETTGEDVYGTDCPAMTALGDIKGLQVEEKRKAQGIAKMVNPPLKGPPSLAHSTVSSLPGGLTTVVGGANQEKLSSIYTTDPRIQELVLDIEKVEKRIDKAFFVDLFLAISDMEGIQPRNMLELTQRNEEKLVQLGPVLGRVHGEFLEGLIDRTFDQIVAADILPEPPREIRGQELKVRFISVLAMAQNAIATGNIDRLAAFTTGLAGAGYESVLDKFDADQAVDEYGHLIGAPPRLVVPDGQVAEIREQRAQQLQQQRQQDMMLELAKSGIAPAASAAMADLEQDSVVSRTVENAQRQAGQ